jgi:hypothetical protein
MNKPIIRSYKDLQKEQERLRAELDMHKAAINEKVQAIKQKLAPVGTVLSAVSGIAAASIKNPLVTSGIGLAVDMLVKKRLFKKSGLVTGLLGGFLVRNVATKVLTGAAGMLIGKLLTKKKKPAVATT